MKKNIKKRKICFPITNRAYYGRVKLLLAELQRAPDVELQVILGGAIPLDKYSQNIHAEIVSTGLPVEETLFHIVDGGNHIAMAKTAALIGLEFANIIYKLNPDIVVVNGDRFEQLPIAMTAAYLNTMIAHIEGGDITGSVDESIRHAVTKLSHAHFVTNEESRKRVIQMGEDSRYVFNVGSLDIEVATAVKKKLQADFFKTRGAGDDLDISMPFIVVMYHPVITQTKEENWRYVTALADSIHRIGLPAVWFWPNNDAGTGEISEAIRHLRERDKGGTTKGIRFVTNLQSEDFIALLKRASCLVGNSSSGIKECSYLGTPVVNLGSRQNGRLRGENVIDVIEGDAQAIEKAVKKQCAHGPFKSSRIYWKPRTAKNIARVLRTMRLYTQKKFYD
ncbi:MAG: UDP-N-acetylglucosamine 2-epimerase [Patescibacteria group bacterium]